MQDLLPEKYHDWIIQIRNEGDMCANFSFDITSPSGNTQHVSMGGHTADDARNRAREMIDMEIAFMEGE